MANIVCIETSGVTCGVAIAVDGHCAWVKTSEEPQRHANLLSPYVEEALSFLRTQGKAIDAVAVSMGPGSYTGLRIGVATAKGLCFALSVPLIAIPTLRLLASQAEELIDRTNDQSLLCPMIDARRMEVYTALYELRSPCEVVKEPWAEVVSERSFSDYAQGHDIYFFGSGATKCQDVITSPCLHFVEGVEASAQGMARLAQSDFDERRFVDVAYFEPFYLKDFVATTPKHKVI